MAGPVYRTDYQLLAAGRDKAPEIASQYPTSAGRAPGSKLVVELAEGQSATQLKDRQYIQQEYLQTPNGRTVRPLMTRAMYIRTRAGTITIS